MLTVPPVVAAPAAVAEGAVQVTLSGFPCVTLPHVAVAAPNLIVAFVLMPEPVIVTEFPPDTGPEEGEAAMLGILARIVTDEVAVGATFAAAVVARGVAGRGAGVAAVVATG